MRKHTNSPNNNIKKISLLILLFVFMGCTNYPPYEEIEDTNLKLIINNILVKAEKLNENEYVLIKMDTLTKFSWDKMFVFCGNTQSNEINKSIGFLWDYSSGHELLNEGNILIIFVKKQKVVSSAVYIEGDERYKSFRVTGIGDGIVSENSIFYVDKQFDTHNNYALRFTHQSESNRKLLGFLKKNLKVSLSK